MEQRNRKIIDAVIEKADRDFPGTLALIGVYGSFLTGDIHKRSDLDLLILINDDRGWQLGCAFVQDDISVGHDIYCTGWDALESDASFTHPNIAKLMDSKIVYCADERYLTRLEALRSRVRATLQAPFSQDDFTKAELHLKDAEHHYARAMITSDRSELLIHTGNVLYFIENAIAMLNKTYFRYGTKRVFEELEAMAHCPKNLRQLTDAVLSSTGNPVLKQNLTALMAEVIRVFEDVKSTLSSPSKQPTADSLRGTYEEMYSNWKNKMHVAAELNSKHLAFMSMASMNAMLSDIAAGVDIGRYDIMRHFDPNDLPRCAQGYDTVLQEYLNEYKKVHLQPRHYPDIDAFVADYLEKETAF